MLKFFFFKFTLNHFPLSISPLNLWGLLPLTSLSSPRSSSCPLRSSSYFSYPLIPLYPTIVFHCIPHMYISLCLWCFRWSHHILWCSTISYGVPLYPIIFTVPISWIIHVFHALIYNVIFIFFPLENRFNARLEIRSLGKSSPLHHRNRTWKIYIFWGGI